MGICPLLSRTKIMVVDGKEEVKILEVECIKEKCNLFATEESMCVFLNISGINSLKKGIQVLKASIHDELYDLKYDISDKTEKLINMMPQIAGEISNITKISEELEIIISNLKELQKKPVIDENIKNIFNESVNLINQNLLNISENLKILPSMNEEMKGSLAVLIEKIGVFYELKNSINEIENYNKNMFNILPKNAENIFNNIYDSINNLKNAMNEFNQKSSEIKDLIYDNKNISEKEFTIVTENFNKLFEEIVKLSTYASQDFKNNLKSIENELIKLVETLNLNMFPTLFEIKEKSSEDFEKLILKFDTVTNQITEMANSLNIFGEKTREFSESIFSFVSEIKNDFQNIKRAEELKIAEELNDDGILEFYSGNTELAIIKFNEALKLSIKPEIMFNLASALSYKGEKEKAEEILLRIINEFPDYASSFTELGMIAFDKGKIEEAIDLMTQGLEKEPKNQFILANIGYTFEKLNDIENALKFWRKAIEIDPSLFEVQDSINFYTERRI